MEKKESAFRKDVREMLWMQLCLMEVESGWAVPLGDIEIRMWKKKDGFIILNVNIDVKLTGFSTPLCIKYVREGGYSCSAFLSEMIQVSDKYNAKLKGDGRVEKEEDNPWALEWLNWKKEE